MPGSSAIIHELKLQCEVISGQGGSRSGKKITFAVCKIVKGTIALFELLFDYFLLFRKYILEFLRLMGTPQISSLYLINNFHEAKTSHIQIITIYYWTQYKFMINLLISVSCSLTLIANESTPRCQTVAVGISGREQVLGVLFTYPVT